MAASKPSAEQLITDNIDVWTSAIKKRGSQGRGSNKKITLYGIKKLRELILELAVRGLLVPQNPSDESASVLLEKIAAEKEQLIKDGKIKPPKLLPSISYDEKPFELPAGWTYARFIDLAFSYRVGLDRGKSQQGTEKQFKYFKMNNILNEGGLQLNDITGVDADRREVKDYQLHNGDFLFNTRNSKELVGKTCVFISDDEQAILYNNNILRANFLNITLSQIIDIWMRSSSGQSLLDLIKSGTTNVWAIYQGKLESLLCVLPPESEQPRIVAKVNELMALCDQLEQQTESSLTAHQTLVETLLNTLLTAAQTTGTKESNSQSNSDQESSFDQAWNRIAQHFDVLFTTEHSIDQLKQTILQLAVMGKLVPQDPNDEPASVLLEKIAAEKEQLIKDKKIKKQKPLPPISEDEKPFELPQGWEWVRVDTVSSVTGGIQKQQKRRPIKNIFPYLRVANVQRGKISVDDLSLFELFEGELERYKLASGDILIVEGNGSEDEIGRCAIWQGEIENCVHQNHLIRLRILNKGCELFFEKFLNSPSGILEMKKLAVTTSGLYNLSVGKIKPIVVPMPPEAEQPRIVRKVNKLIALCETLKKELSESQSTQLHLADAITEQELRKT